MPPFRLYPPPITALAALGSLTSLHADERSILMASVAAVSPMPNDSALSSVAANQANGHVVLVVTDSESITKRIESYLRNAGHPVRTAWVNDIEDVEEALRRGAPDLVLWARTEARRGGKEC